MDFLLNWLVQGGVVALAAAAVLHATPRSRTQARYAIAWAASVIVVALPAAVPEHAMPRLRYDEYATRLVAANYSTTVRADEFTVDIPEGGYVPDRLRRRSRRPAAAD